MKAAVVAAALALATLIPASAMVASPLSFTQPTFIDHQPSYGPSAPVSRRQAMTGISCPSVALCVAVDWWGNVVTTTAPLAGSAGWRIARADNLSEGHVLSIWPYRRLMPIGQALRPGR